MSTPTIEDVLACPNLPTLPAVAVEVLELTNDEGASVEHIADVVQNDPALTAKILRTVNSSYYALPSPCTTISRALTYMGLSTVKSLVLGFSLRNITSDVADGFELEQYWRRCLYGAAAARRVAARHGSCDPDEAFSAALMADIGMLAIHAATATLYDQVVARTEGNHAALVREEREAFGFDHPEIGARLAERWDLPAPLIETIRHHHDGAATGHTDLVRIVSLGIEAAVAASTANPSAAMACLCADAKSWFELEAKDIAELMHAVSDDTAELGKLFDVKTGDPLDVNWLLAEAEQASVVNQLAIERETETLRRSNDELAKQAITDGLTKIGNRKRFDDELANRFEQAVSFRGTMGLVLIDVDHFKAVNDTHGHQVGDAVLVELAERLAGAVRSIDLVCRYGGEEFGAIVPGAMLKDVAIIAERLRSVVEDRPFDLSHVDDFTGALPITASVGVAVYDPETASILSTPSVLVQAADKALYAAKESGRNCVRVFRPGPSAAAA
jgi:diguanylate cyclase (GGDEF)-like protein